MGLPQKEPAGFFQRPNGEYVLVHRRLGCELERFNRIAGDDDFELVLSLPSLPPRTSREMKAQRLEKEPGEELSIDEIAWREEERTSAYKVISASTGGHAGHVHQCISSVTEIRFRLHLYSRLRRLDFPRRLR